MESDQLALPIDSRPEPSWSGRWRRAARWGLAAMRVLLSVAAAVAGAVVMLSLFPYRGTARGVHFEVGATLATRPGVSIDTTVGSWVFPHVTALPFGVHLTPRDVDVVTLSANAPDRAAFVADLQDAIRDQVPQIAAWLVATTVIGIVLGLGVAAAVELALRHLRGLPRRADELRIRGRELAVTALVLVLLAVTAAVTYDSRWTRESRTTGTLAALQLFPDQLADYYEQRSKFTDVIGGISAVQAQLQQTIESQAGTVPSLRIMTISDMHLAGTYPLVLQYARNFSVDLVVNTGDEAEFGTRAEMTDGYLDQVRELTRDVPMIWVAGNHDSPETIQVMRSIPGVTVLGTKTATADGYSVAGQTVDVFGLTVGGVPDPRVYGAAGAYGADARDVVDPLERQAMESAVAPLATTATFDLMVTHEPVAAARLRELLPDRIRQTNSGHTHVQNASDEIQPDQAIDLIEGTTGAGGLDNLQRDGLVPPPIAFSIESVSIDCQFTRVLRFRLGSPPPPGFDPLSTADREVTATTVYLRPAPSVTGRTCTRSLGIGAVRDFGAGIG